MNHLNGVRIIDDATPDSYLFNPNYARGGEPRDYSVQPKEMFASPSEMPIIPRNEWDARIAEQEALQSSLEHIRLRAANGNMMPVLNQTSWPYCWTHSGAHAVMLSRARDNQPYVPLSAFAVAAIIKGGRSQGGWCGLAAQFIREVGIPSQQFWPQGSAKLSYDTPEMRANAALHKVTEDWVDLTKNVYDQNLTFDQVASCLLTNIPVALDFNWWGHSICGLRLIRIAAGEYGIKILNSWGDDWEDRGMVILQGNRAIPDGAVAFRTTIAAAA